MAPRCVGGLLAVLLGGGLGLARAGQAPENDKAQAGRLLIRAVAAANGAALEGASVQYQGRLDGKPVRGTITTGADGTALYEWKAEAKIESLALTARKAGFAPVYIYWTNRTHPVTLPAEKELRLEPGTTIGGVVKDEDGKPIGGAKVEISAPATESEMHNFYFRLGETRTDDAGRWRLADAPASFGNLIVHVTHPEFHRGGGRAARDPESVTVLERGLTLRGRVVDASGQPVNGARAVLGHDIWGSDPPTATTGPDGSFALKNCKPGASIVTIQADGFAPRFQDVQVEQGTAALEFRLEPPATIRIRVIDAAGKPIAAAHVAADTWRGHRSIMFRKDVDAEGRFNWPSAPPDAVLFDIFKLGYMARRHVPVTASDQEQDVVLYPELTISGRITDARSGQQVPGFRVIQGRQFEGRDQIYWERSGGSEGTTGKYATTFGEPAAALLVRIEAPGYKTADSRAFRPSEGAQTYDFRLEPTQGLTGIILRPEGQPAAGVEVALATSENRAMLKMGFFDPNSNVPKATTGPDGRFSFSPPDAGFLLIALSDAGFVEATGEELAKQGNLRLQPWGRIEGQALIGRRPAANQEISFQPTRPQRGNAMYVFDYGYTTETDADGRFAFDRVIPGPGSVSRVVVTEFAGGSSQHMGCWQEPLDVQPGLTARATIGGKGRAVIGTVVLEGTPETPVNWRQNQPAEITRTRDELGEGPRGWDRFAANMEPDGRFRVDDVPPGRYMLSIPVNVPPDPRFCGAGTEIGRATTELTVPDPVSDTPIDLGTIKAVLFATLKAGDLAPAFTADRLDGTPLRLADYAGKLVLLDFWATWCGPCLAEMPAMKDLCTSFAADPRLVVIGLSCDAQPDAPLRYVKENTIDWTQAFAGSMNTGVSETYKVRAIPATFLIGPDGRVLAKNLRGPELKRAVAEALKNEALFAAPPKPVGAPARP